MMKNLIKIFFKVKPEKKKMKMKIKEIQLNK